MFAPRARLQAMRAAAAIAQNYLHISQHIAAHMPRWYMSYNDMSPHDITSCHIVSGHTMWYHTYT